MFICFCEKYGMPPRKHIKITWIAVGALHPFRFVPMLLFLSKSTSGLCRRTVSAHLALICKVPAISTVGIAIRTPCAEKAIFRGVSIGIPRNHLAEMLLGASLLIFSGLVLPWKVCTNARPCYWASGPVWAVICFPCGRHDHIFHWNLMTTDSERTLSLPLVGKGSRGDSSWLSTPELF